MTPVWDEVCGMKPRIPLRYSEHFRILEETEWAIDFQISLPLNEEEQY